MVDGLKHLQLVVDHVLVPFDILLEDNLDCDLLPIHVCFAYDAIGSSTQRPAESVLHLLIVTIRLAMEAVDHASD